MKEQTGKSQATDTEEAGSRNVCPTHCTQEGTSDDHTEAEECELVLELPGSVILRGSVDGNNSVGRLAVEKV
jgi:hypothetical protein